MITNGTVKFLRRRMLVQGDICVAPGSLAEKVLASALRKLRVTHNSLDRRVA